MSIRAFGVVKLWSFRLRRARGRAAFGPSGLPGAAAAAAATATVAAAVFGGVAEQTAQAHWDVSVCPFVIRELIPAADRGSRAPPLHQKDFGHGGIFSPDCGPLLPAAPR